MAELRDNDRDSDGADDRDEGDGGDGGDNRCDNRCDSECDGECDTFADVNFQKKNVARLDSQSMFTI